MERVRAFFAEIDARWGGAESEPLELRLIGSTALMVLTDFDRGTKDSDVLETTAMGGVTKERLVELAGPGTVIARRHGMYLDIVGNGVPFLPHGPKYHDLAELNAGLRRLRVVVLDVVDVVVSKLKRFHRDDQDDIRAMVRRGKVPHMDLVQRFRAAVDEFWVDARAEELPKYVEHLHRVERDVYDVGESEIELPGWI